MTYSQLQNTRMSTIITWLDALIIPDFTSKAPYKYKSPDPLPNGFTVSDAIGADLCKCMAAYPDLESSFFNLYNDMAANPSPKQLSSDLKALKAILQKAA